MLAHGASRTAVVKAIWVSTAHLAAEVNGFYQAILHHGANAAGRNYYVNVLRNGGSEVDVQVSLLSSREYLVAHPDNVSFVMGLYADVLGEAPDPQGEMLWLNVLQTGLNRKQVARLFLQSDAARRAIVDEYFMQFLHRTPTADEENNWVAFLARPRTSWQLMARSLLASGELYQWAAQHRT
jgi:hypothetical protein